MWKVPRIWVSCVFVWLSHSTLADLADDVAIKVFEMINHNYGICGGSLVARDKQTLLSSLQILRPTISQNKYSSREVSLFEY